MPRLSLGVALGVGVAGALVDVSSYARLTDGVSYRWGRSDAFYGAEPGTFSFVLDNADGRFTPDNSSSPLDTPLTEGMAACISVEGRLTGGTVRSIEPEFPGGDAAWAAVRVSCDDLLGAASRTRIRNPTGAQITIDPYLYWPMDEAETSSSAREFFGGPSLNPTPGPGPGIVFSAEGPGAGAGSLEITNVLSLATSPQTFKTVNVASGVGLNGVVTYPVGSIGSWCVWLKVGVDADTLSVRVTSGFGFDLNASPDGIQLQLFGGVLSARSAPVVDEWQFVAVDLRYVGTSVAADLYVNGSLVGTSTLTAAGTPTNAQKQVRQVSVQAFSGAVDSTSFVSQLAHTQSTVLGYAFASTTGAIRAEGIARASLGLTLQAIPSAFGEEIVEAVTASEASALDMLNSVVDAEQGHMYQVTTGTLTAPVQELALRERDRPTTVSYTFDVEDELSGAPAFVRDLTNLASEARVSNATTEVSVFDASLNARAGSASSSETLILENPRDLRSWGQDRLRRGANTTMQIQSVVVDAMTTPTDRSADLLALIPGDRVQFTGLPSIVLGFDTWDGWFLGAEEAHTLEEHSFALYFQPVLPAVAKYDTATYMASGELALNGAINSAVTSISVESTGALLSTTAVPYVIQIDSEQMTVTAVSGASSPQTVTVTRAANGTTAASHSDGAVLVGPIPVAIYAF